MLSVTFINSLCIVRFQKPQRGSWPVEQFHWQTGRTRRGPGRTWVPRQPLAPPPWPLVSGKEESQWRCRQFRRQPPPVQSSAELASVPAAAPAPRSYSESSGTLRTDWQITHHFTSSGIQVKQKQHLHQYFTQQLAVCAACVLRKDEKTWLLLWNMTF